MVTAALAIDIANPSEHEGAAGIALGVIEGDAVRALEHRALDSNTRRSDGVIALLADACAAHDIEPRSIERIAVTAGPGGYTATRIGVTAGVTLAHACDARLTGVPSWLSAWWARDRANDTGGTALVALAGKRDSAHITRAGDGVPEPLGVRTPDELRALAPARVLAGAHLPEGFAEVFEQLGARVEPVRMDARVLLEHAHRLPPADNPAEVQPVYAREPDAVTQWRTLHPEAFSDAEPA